MTKKSMPPLETWSSPEWKKGKGPTFSVIVPVFEQWSQLSHLLDALEALDSPEGGFEVILVNNEAASVTSEEPRPGQYSFPLRVVHEPVPGSYRARNTGAAVATGIYLAFTDADCLPSRGWLLEADKLVKTGVEFIAGRIRSVAPEGKLNLAQLFGTLAPFNQDEVARRGEALTANVIVNREVFLASSGFNEALYSGGDLEWSRRVSRTTKLVYSDSASVDHPVRSSLRAIFKKRRRIVGGLVALAKIRGNRLPWLRWLLPPRLCWTVWKEPELTFHEKAQIAVVRYALQLYGAWHRVLLTTGVTRPVRS